MALSGKSLDAVSATGPGAAIMFDEPHTNHSLSYSTTGSPTSVAVELEGTIDGTNWFGLFSAGNPPFGNSIDFPLLGIRANLTTLVGGVSPTVTAWVATA